jgi:phytoene synthase
MDASDGPAYCAHQVRRHDYDRYLCALFAPAEQRQALVALYAFNLEVATIREVVSEPLLGQMRLQWWRDAMEAAYAGTAPPHPVAQPLGEAIRRFDLTRGHFDRLLEARAFDLDDGAPADTEALLAYVEATSATLVALALEVVGETGEAASDAGYHVGMAWGLTGLLRSVPFHAAARRVYLPATLCRDAGVELSDLFELRSGEGLVRAVAELAEVARHHLASARRDRKQIEKRVLPALLPATLAGGYLNALEKAGFDPFGQSVGAAGPGQLIRLAVTALRRRF